MLRPKKQKEEAQEPPRWRELCSELQRERNPVKFEALLEEIDRLLTEYEKKQAKAARAP